MTTLISGAFSIAIKATAPPIENPHTPTSFYPSRFEKSNGRQEILDLFGSGGGIAPLAFPQIAEIEQQEVGIFMQSRQGRQVSPCPQDSHEAALRSSR